MKKRWKLNPVDKGLKDTLASKLEVLPITAQLLINRGLVDCDKAFSFLSPDLKDLRDPFLLKDMDRAVERVLRAVKSGERIAVYGDYDVDGTSSAALLYLFFREMGVQAECYIPEREKEGYGLNAEAMKRLKAKGVSLLITVDCGTSNRDEVSFASSIGIDVIVTDHHEVPSEIPPAYALINPKRKDCPFPFKGLAGVGVAFNFVMALRSRLRTEAFFRDAEPNLKRYLDLVAVGTVADMAPLLDENRIFVSWGLKEIANPTRPGLKALRETASYRGALDSDTIAFTLAPRLNAAGRLGTAMTSFRLLTTEDSAEAASLAALLQRENLSRQRLEEEILNDALGMLKVGVADRGIVLFSEDWHPGVIGIVASRIVERFARPAVMVALSGGIGKGSARGIKSFDILEGLKACSAHLERFGGHKAAAGLTVRRDRLDAFRQEFIRHLNSTLTDEDLVPEIVLDAAVSLGEVDMRLVEEAGALAPFGVSNKEPLLCINGARIVQTEVVKGKHLRFSLQHDGCRRTAIGFNLAEMHPMEGNGFSIAFSPYADEWQGVRNPGIRIRDVKAGPQV